MSQDTVIIEQRFNGPPNSGNGGYVCGVLARYLDGTAAVRLKVPPPLDTELRIGRVGDGAVLRDGETVVAEAQPGRVDLAAPSPPTYAEAEAAAEKYRGFEEHGFATCFVCGPERAPGDGLRIFVGDVSEKNIVASPWTPDVSLADDAGRIKSEFIWAALDCPGAFTFPQVAGMSVLGELAVAIEGAVCAGEPHVVTAWFIGKEGRKRYAGSALYTADGKRLAIAKATWIALAPRA